ncbi:hypothetical protein R3P38DRAFT_2980942 [Favolaschia claudopus]|uniref:Uncharacterized protein n=1 Tax=Favolaschia claudopus TaxID=2862362 RepID=A0AAW0B1N2_9AGAR
MQTTEPMNPSTSQSTPLSPTASIPSQWIHTFVAFTIDPVASLSEGVREIPEAVAACKKLRNKTYVGLIAKWRGLYQPWEPYNTCLLRFLQQGDPVGQSEEFITPAMSVPVLPVTSNAHISGRPPLRPSKLLPWSDCYLSISAGACVRTPSSFTIDPPEWKLDREESLRLHFLCVDDIEEMEDRQHAHKTEVRNQTTNEDLETMSLTSHHTEDDAMSVSSSEFCSQSSQSSVESIAHEDPVADAEIDVDEGEASLTELFQDIFASDDHEKAMITLRFTHDLSLVQELNSPADYLKEVEAIESIEKEFAPPTRIEECKALKRQEILRRVKETNSSTRYDDQTLNMNMNLRAEESDCWWISPKTQDGGPQQIVAICPDLNSLEREKTCSAQATEALGEKHRRPLARVAWRLKKWGKTAIFRALKRFRPLLVSAAVASV